MEQQLYELPDGWEWRALSSATRIGAERGFIPEVKDGKAPFIGMSDIDQDTGLNTTHELREFEKVRRGYTKFQKNAVLLAKITPCTENNKTALIRNLEGGYATTEVYPIHPLSETNPLYLLQFFRSPSIRALLISKMEGATGRQRVPTDAVVSLKIPLPPLDEQKRIVAKLDALFTRIDTVIIHLQETLELSKALFASALVDSLKDNAGWETVKIKKVFKVVNGRAYKRPELLESGKYPVVRIQNLKGGETYYYSDLELKKDKYCDAGDLLYSWSGTPGTSFGAFIWQGGKSIYHYHIWKMEPLLDLNIRLAYWLLRDLTEEAIASSRGVAGMLHITKGMMESFDVQLPPLEEQARVAGNLDALAERTRALEDATDKKLNHLAALKASLLDAAFRGQL